MADFKKICTQIVVFPFVQGGPGLYINHKKKPRKKSTLLNTLNVSNTLIFAWLIINET